MDIQTYQREARRTMRTDLTYYENLSMLSMGMTGEAGEVSEILKKFLYHGHALDRREVEKELGDVMFYLTNLATELDLSMENILEKNIEKLKVRYPDPCGFSIERSLNRIEYTMEKNK